MLIKKSFLFYFGRQEAEVVDALHFHAFLLAVFDTENELNNYQIWIYHTVFTL